MSGCGCCCCVVQLFGTGLEPFDVWLGTKRLPVRLASDAVTNSLHGTRISVRITGSKQSADTNPSRTASGSVVHLASAPVHATVLKKP